jgi:pseudouridine kinase
MSDASIAHKNVVVFGGSNMDISGKPAGDLVRANSNPGRASFSLGGVARNVAEVLSRLGASTTLLTAVGDDAFGRQLLAGCVETGVDVRRVLTSDRYPTSVYLSLLTRDGDLDAAVSDMDIMTELSPAYVSENEQIIGGAALTVADTNLGRPTLEALLSTQRQGPLFVDGVSASKVVRLAGLLDRIEVLKLNRLEAEVLTNIKINDTASTQRALDRLLGEGVKKVYLTLGQGGMVWGGSIDGSSEERGKVTLPSMEAVNANGAGDVCTAALAFSILQALGLEESARFAVAASVLALRSESTTPPQLTLSTVRETMTELGLA